MRTLRFRERTFREPTTGAPPTLSHPPLGAAEIGAGQVPTSRLGVDTVIEQTFSEVAITDTVNFTAVTSVVLTTTSHKSLLVVPLVVHVKHSVAGATFRMEWDLYETSTATTGITISRVADTVALDTANAWYPFTSISTQDLETAGTNYGPGEHLLRLWARPNTAGTLTVGGTTGTSSRYFSVFLVGRK